MASVRQPSRPGSPAELFRSQIRAGEILRRRRHSQIDERLASGVRDAMNLAGRGADHIARTDLCHLLGIQQQGRRSRSTSQICSEWGWRCLAEIAPGSIVTRVIVTSASSALWTEIICAKLDAGLLQNLEHPSGKATRITSPPGAGGHDATDSHCRVKSIFVKILLDSPGTLSYVSSVPPGRGARS